MKKKMFGVIFIFIICFILVGCNKNNKIDLESTDTKEVIKYSNFMTYVYYHDKSKVTGFEIYIKYDDNASAKNVYNANKKENTYNQPALKSVKVIDNYIVMKYNEDGYQGITTYEELMNFSNQFK